jgi:hypothetical protein
MDVVGESLEISDSGESSAIETDDEPEAEVEDQSTNARRARIVLQPDQAAWSTR